MTASLLRTVGRPYAWAKRSANRALFDRRYGLDTDGVIQPGELGFDNPEYTRYAPAGLVTLRRLLPPGDVGPDDVFVDIGSGKGRVVLQAALRHPFRTVYGVELSERLHEVAVRNLASVRDRLRCQDVRLVHGNALEFDVPDDTSVVFLYNPFDGATFAQVVERILASVDRAPRRLRILYGNPREEAALLATGRVHPVRTLRGWRPGREWSRSNTFRVYEVV